MSKEIQIEKIAYGGEGVGFLDGKVCFVEGALPEETVKIEVIADKKNFSRAKLLEVVSASSHRVDPPCPYIESCGGCQYQHLSYDQELFWKQTQVEDVFCRKFSLAKSQIKDICSSDEPYHYRNSLSLHPLKEPQGKTFYGFAGKEDNKLVPIDECLLANQDLARVFEERKYRHTHDETIQFWRSDTGQIYSNVRDEFFRMDVGSQTLLTSTQGFFQNNGFVADQMVRQVQGWIKKVRPKNFFDLYAGVGLFAILSAKFVPQVYCLEENPWSVKCLRKNLKEKRKRATIHEGKVEITLPKVMKTFPRGNTMALLDPPRKGVEPDLMCFLGSQPKIQSLVYVSCHLGTLSRDLELLLKNSDYKILEVASFDMFPRTKHIELAVLLRRASEL